MVFRSEPLILLGFEPLLDLALIWQWKTAKGFRGRPVVRVVGPMIFVSVHRIVNERALVYRIVDDRALVLQRPLREDVTDTSGIVFLPLVSPPSERPLRSPKSK
jgi:hypothetical protein